ncbi:MAG: polyprenyl synthetase family protein, partial [Bacteroidota bacterium]
AGRSAGNPTKVRYLIDYVYANGGIEYSRNVMDQYIKDAEAILREFPDTPARSSLIDLMYYSIRRKK